MGVGRGGIILWLPLHDASARSVIPTPSRPAGQPSVPANLPPPPLRSYVANETLGTKQAKLRMLEKRGWVVLPLRWTDK